MENKLARYGSVGLVVATLLLTVLAIMSFNSSKADASINDSSNAYQSTTTRSAFNGTAIGSQNVVSLGFGTFGSVIITGASGANTGIINIYDATSTGAHSDYATTTLASFPAQAGAGTYTFDVEYRRGLLIEVIGTVGTSTITWKK